MPVISRSECKKYVLLLLKFIEYDRDFWSHWVGKFREGSGGGAKSYDRLTNISALKPLALCLKPVTRFEWLKAERGDTANTKRVLKTVRPSCRALILLAAKYLA